MIKIKNEYIEVKIKTIGAELNSIKKSGDEHEYLWQGNKPFWERQSPILFPIVGKLLDHEYVYNNETYKMSKHGLCRDVEFEVISEQGDAVILKYDMKANDSYPFNCDLLIGYKLEKNKLVVTYEVINKMNCVLPFSIGGHPAFVWESDAYLAFSADELNRYALSEYGIENRTEKLEVVDGKLPLSNKLFKDDALIFEKQDMCHYVYGERAVRMSFKGFPWLGIWSMASGAPFVCIEPWYGVDDFKDHNKNILEKKGIQLLGAHKTFNANYSIEIE